MGKSHALPNYFILKHNCNFYILFNKLLENNQVIHLE